MRRLAVTTALALSLATAACGGSSSSPKAAAAADALPTVAGAYGDKPVLTFPASGPPPAEKTTVLREGTGPVVAKGDLLVADYLGQVWKGKVFDNSYDRGASAGFPIGVGQVVEGWDDTLVGLKAGTRLLMSLPPAKGYKEAGNAQAGITGTDTLVFVVDVIASYSAKVGGDLKAVPTGARTAGITVTGPLGSKPTVKVAKGTVAPKALTIAVLDKGHGAPAAAGTLVVQYEAVTYAGATAGSTWGSAPMAATLTASGMQGAFDKLRGIPLGSRVLLTTTASAQQPAAAVVVDLVAQPGTAKTSG